MSDQVENPEDRFSQNEAHINSAKLESLMFYDHQTSGSREEDFKGFPIYGCGGLLGHVNWTIYRNCCCPFPWRPHIKFVFDLKKTIIENNGHIIVYGHGGHLGHVTWTIYTHFHSCFQRELHLKSVFDWPIGFRGEDL